MIQFDSVKSTQPHYAHTCVLLEVGGVRCWGRNKEDQLGYNLPDDYISDPISVGMVPLF